MVTAANRGGSVYLIGTLHNRRGHGSDRKTFIVGIPFLWLRRICAGLMGSVGGIAITPR